MKSITANTTDLQIAVRAASSYYPNGAAPELCQSLVNVCRHLYRLPEGSWPETTQGWRQARESFDRLDTHLVGHIVSQVEGMESLRATAQRKRALSLAGRVAKPHQRMVDSIVGLSRESREYPDHDDFYFDVILQALPSIPESTAHAISMVCVHRVRG
jgi:hypothetical protein